MTKLITIKDLKRWRQLRQDVKRAYNDDIRARIAPSVASFFNEAWQPVLDQLDATFAEVNGRATTHTYAADVLPGFVLDTEVKLEKAGVTVANRPGTRAVFRSGVPESKAYNRQSRTAIATEIVLVRTGTAWKLESVKRVERYAGPGGAERIEIHVTPAAKADIERKAFEGFAVLPPPAVSAPSHAEQPSATA